MFKKIRLINKTMELVGAIQDLLNKDSATINSFKDWVNTGIKLFPSLGNIVKQMIEIVKG